MNAKQARAATSRSKAEKEREAEAEAARERARKHDEDEWSRTSAYPAFMKKLRAEIAEATRETKRHVRTDTTNEIVAKMVVEKLRHEGYEVCFKRVYVEACNEYGSSGEGMHDAYDSYHIHVNWGRKGECPTCEEEFRLNSQYRRW